jgi:sulfur relay (sulfurtransferase) DsrC/TusE family protein
MKVFISWSGDLSKNIAEIFRQWLPSVIQAVKPYYSPDDITKGTRWNTEISKELDDSKIGIICLTRDNIEKPWIMFEAGAISKNLDKAKVCPLLFGLEPTDIQGPLVQFQSAKFSKKEMKRVVKMINSELGENALNNEVLDNVFDKWYPELDKKIQDELSNDSQKDKSEIRSDRDILEEILKLSRDNSSMNGRLNPKIFLELPHIITRLVECVDRLQNGDEKAIIEFDDHIERLMMFIEEFTYSFEMSKGMRMEFREMTRHLKDETRFRRRKMLQ